MSSTLVYIVYPVASFVVFLFGVIALIIGTFHLRKNGPDTQEFFLTARNSANVFRIAFSYFAGVLGSWSLFGLPSFAYTAGYVGLITYSLFAGLPIVIVAYLGVAIQERIPRVFSFSDYVQKRFGKIVQLYISAVMLVTMGTALTVEYTTVGSLFSIIIGTTQIPIIIIIAVVSTVYTAYGGLHISLITDQIQAGLALVLVVVLFSWVAATFRPKLGPLPENLSGKNYTGLASIASMPISLTCSVFFSEGPWQRCWASESHKTLRKGAIIGASMIVVVCFLFGFGGFLAAWSGYFVPTGPDDYGNTVLFSLLANSVGSTQPTTWITVIVACLSVTMSTSAVDTLQNAITDNIAGVYLKDYSVWWSRLLVVGLNVPCVVISLRDYNVISLFLLCNLLNATATIPVLLGLWRGPLAQRVVTPASCLFGCVLAMVAVIVYGVLQAPHWHMSVDAALHSVFLGLYDWPPFVIALGFSVIGVVLMAAFENLVNYRLLGQYCLEDLPEDGITLGEDHALKAKPLPVYKVTGYEEA